MHSRQKLANFLSNVSKGAQFSC